MKIAVLEFPTRSLLGILDDAGAETVAEVFGLAGAPEPPSTDEEIPALVRLEWPARVEIMQWQQQEESRIAGQPAQMQLVSRPFAVMVGVSRLSVDAGQAIAAEVFDVAETNVAQIGGDNGVTLAKPAWSSDEPLVAIYLQALEAVVARGKRPIGRQRVRIESK